MDKLAPYSKAVAGAFVGGLTALATGLADGVVEPVEWVAVALATILGTGIVYAAPANKPKPTDYTV